MIECGFFHGDGPAAAFEAGKGGGGGGVLLLSIL